MCWGLNSHCLPMVGMVINLTVGVYIPIMRIPVTLGGMTIPNIPQYKELIDPGTCGCSSNHEGPQWLLIWHKTTTWSLICSSQNGPLIVWGPQAIRIRIFNNNNDVQQNSWFGRVLFQLLWFWIRLFPRQELWILGGKRVVKNPTNPMWL